jgi:hypothetical protein
MREVRVSLLFLLATGLIACESFPGSRAGGGCPVMLVDSERISDAGLLRQRIRVGDGDREVSIETVVQIEPGELVVVGFTPFGTRAFTIRQRGQDLEIEDRVARAMGIRAIWLLDALHRSRWIAAPDASGGESERWEWGGETVEQQRAGPGGPLVRVFRVTAGGSSATSDLAVRVEYSDAETSSVQIENPWCGYRARIETVSTERGE